MNGQTNIYEMLYENYKIKTPIKMIELFAGYGATSFGWKYLNIPFEHHKICEWAVNSIQAYKDAHMPDDNNDYSKDKTKEELIEILYKYGISSNYNEPMKYEQIARMSESKIRTIYNNIIATHNLVNIQNVKADDLEITNTYLLTYLLTYSFPCQDLSQSGKRKGMSDTSTRSGMLWEVERILSECKELPQILIMENVPQVKSEANLDSWNKWLSRLEEFGYKNYFQDLIATDYGIPQIRKRCFMVSILGNYNYIFPKREKLKTKLQYILEEKVDERFYLEKDLLRHINKTKIEHKEYTEYARWNGEFEQLCRVWKRKAPTLHTKCNEIKIYDKKGKMRRITTLEAFRLMGVKDEDFERIARHQSNASLYHLAGDSIVVDVIKAIYGQLI